jgi:redox-sensitive bicupin YhaK (pirin superfamily)
MTTIRRAEDRGLTDWGWLTSRHSFSFGEYHDPEHTGFRTLRVINDDWVKPGAGFGAHPHRDMEILSLVLDGALEHRDSIGNGSIIRPGEIQHMRAGTGVVHSERNPSSSEPVHFLQIWIVPISRGLTPIYGQLTFDAARARQDIVLLASADGRDGSLSLLQDVDVWTARIDRGDDERELPLRETRAAWVHVARGQVTVNGHALKAGDAASITDASVRLAAGLNAEVLLFDLG